MQSLLSSFVKLIGKCPKALGMGESWSEQAKNFRQVAPPVIG
jgi:hypothetical protein